MKRIHRLFYPPAWSIAAKVSAALLAAALIPMSFNAYYNLQESIEGAVESEYRQMELLSTSIASRLDQLIINLQPVVVQVSTEPSVVSFLSLTATEQQKGNNVAIQQTLDNIFRSNPDYDAVYVMNQKGRCLAASDPTFIGQNYSFWEYFQAAIQGNPYVSSILIGTTSSRPGIYFSHPVRSEEGKIIGVAVLKIQGDQIWTIVNTMQGDSQSSPFLVDRLGVIIAHQDPSLLYHSLTPLSKKTQQQIAKDRRYGQQQIESLNLPKLAAAMVRAEATGHASYYSPADEQTQQMVGFTPLSEQPWVLGVYKPKSQFVSSLITMIWRQSRSLILVGAIAIILALLLAQSIARPIRELTEVSQALEKDSFAYDKLTKFARSRDDIGQLMRVFINMAREIEVREQKLKQQVVQLNFEIDEVKKERQVAAVTGTEYFQQLKQKAQRLRKRSPVSRHNEAEYYQQLQQKAQRIKAVRSRGAEKN